MYTDVMLSASAAKLAMNGPWKASVVTVRKYTALPLGRYWLAKFGSVMSGLVELGVMSIRLASEAIGDMALPEPLICGPTTAMTLGSATNCFVLVAACAGSYRPAATVPSSLTSGWIFMR